MAGSVSGNGNSTGMGRNSKQSAENENQWPFAYCLLLTVYCPSIYKIPFRIVGICSGGYSFSGQRFLVNRFNSSSRVRSKATNREIKRTIGMTAVIF